MGNSATWNITPETHDTSVDQVEPTGPAAGPPATAARRLSSFGRGLATPFRRAAADFATVAGPDKVRAAVAQILGTLAAGDGGGGGELEWRQNFGSRLERIRFMPEPVAEEVARVYVIEALRRWEPRIRVKDVAVHPATAAAAGDTLAIRVRYDLVDRTTGVVLVQDESVTTAA